MPSLAALKVTTAAMVGALLAAYGVLHDRGWIIAAVLALFVRMILGEVDPDA